MQDSSSQLQHALTFTMKRDIKVCGFAQFCLWHVNNFNLEQCGTAVFSEPAVCGFCVGVTELTLSLQKLFVCLQSHVIEKIIRIITGH